MTQYLQRLALNFEWMNLSHVLFHDTIVLETLEIITINQYWWDQKVAKILSFHVPLYTIFDIFCFPDAKLIGQK